MRRGEVWWVDFSFTIGGEIKKNRPSVIISNNSANKVLNRIQVVPLTTKNTERVYPSEAAIFIKGKKHKAMTDQIDTVTKQRVLNKIGKLTDSEISRVEQALKVQLGLN